MQVEAMGVVIGISTQGAGRPLCEEVADVWSGALAVDGISEVTVDVSADAEQSRAMESLSTQVTLAALKALADEGVIGRDKVAAALVKYNLDPSKPNPMSV